MVIAGIVAGAGVVFGILSMGFVVATFVQCIRMMRDGGDSRSAMAKRRNVRDDLMLQGLFFGMLVFSTLQEICETQSIGLKVKFSICVSLVVLLFIVVSLVRWNRVRASSGSEEEEAGSGNVKEWVLA